MPQSSPLQLPPSGVSFTPDGSSADVPTLLIQAEHNTEDTPIRELAVELLLEIFNNTLAVDDQNHYDQLYVLALVCKAWWLLIKSTPEFWRFVDGTNSNWRVALERSKLHPLRVILDLYGLQLVEGYHPGNKDAYWSSIIRHTSRWRYANLELDTRAHLPACEDLAPITESFFLTLRRRVPETPRLLLFGDSNPKLKELSLTNVALRNWSLPWLTGLRYLSLWELKDHAPTLLELRNVLCNSPELKVLRLGKIGFTTIPALDLPPVHLPRLKKLDVRLLDPLTIPYLLSGATAPNCPKVNISTTNYSLIVPAIVSTACAEFLYPSLISRLTRSHQLKILIRRSRCIFHVVGDNDALHPSMHVRLDYLSEQDIFAGWMVPLLAQLPSSASPEVSVELFSSCGLNPLELVNTLRLIPNMTSLETWDKSVCLDELIRALSSPEMVDGRARWMWPKLRHLRLQRLSLDLPSVDILKMVQNRSGLDKDGEQGNMLDWPEPITELRIPDGYAMDDKTYDAIRAIVGPGATMMMSRKNAIRDGYEVRLPDIGG
ncbi:hypothetical protein FRB93_006088 [Tulasnella sp. JGI-2019a]|nr:hypothetical protein FRB93_006088 [Tulasnella sp. JGI-2019a]